MIRIMAEGSNQEQIKAIVDEIIAKIDNAAVSY